MHLVRDSLFTRMVRKKSSAEKNLIHSSYDSGEFPDELLKVIISSTITASLNSFELQTTSCLT
jgi:hypothetical protein